MKRNDYRYARVTDGTSIGTVRAYLPSNYSARMDGDAILIAGRDDHGWTLSGYVIPRLASGLIVATELTVENEGGGDYIGEPDLGDIDYDAEREVFEKESRDCTVQGHHWEHVYPRGGYCRNCRIEY